MMSLLVLMLWFNNFKAHDRSGARQPGQEKSKCHDLGAVWANRLLRRNGLFNDLKALRLLVLFQLFAKPGGGQLLADLLKAFLQSLPLPLDEGKIDLHLRRLAQNCIEIGNRLRQLPPSGTCKA